MCYNKIINHLKTIEMKNLNIKLTILLGVLVLGISQVTFAQEKNSQDQTFVIVETMPEFDGGRDSLFSYISHNISYPAKAKKEGISGRVYVRFVVMKTGKVDSVQIKRGVDPLLDAEAKRVVESMPDWTPGTQRGKSVNVEYVLPISFALK